VRWFGIERGMIRVADTDKRLVLNSSLGKTSISLNSV